MRIRLNDQTIESVKRTTLLGTIISDDLSWDLNVKNIVKKANSRMELLRKVASFGALIEDLKTIYFCLSEATWNSQLQSGTVV